MLLVAMSVPGTLSWAGTSLVVNRVLMVGAAGTPTENCQSLLDALAAIDDASSSNAYLLKLEPGHYYCGGTSVVMKEFVSMEGSGREVTLIEGDGAAPTLLANDHHELSRLTVQNSVGFGTNSTGILVSGEGDAPRLSELDVVISGSADNLGIVALSGASPILQDVNVTVSGGSSAIGIGTLTAAPAFDGVRVTLSGAATGSGIQFTADDSDGEPLELRNVTVAVSATNDARGLEFLSFTGAPRVVNVDVRVTDGLDNYAVYNSDSSVEIRHSYLEASSQALGSPSGGLRPGAAYYGVYNTTGSSGFDVLIENSEIEADLSIRNPTGYTTSVASTRLSGNLIDDGGAYVCIYVWDDLLASVTCPSGAVPVDE